MSCGTLSAQTPAVSPSEPVSAKVDGEKFPPLAPLAAGMWQVLTQPDLPGGGMFAMPRTVTMCLSEADVTSGRISLPSMPACVVRSGTWSGSALALSLSCVGTMANAQVSGSLQASGQSFSGLIEVVLPSAHDATLAPTRLAYRHLGKWQAAACPDGTK